MNLFSIKTAADLQAYNQECLVVTEDINPSTVTGFSRAVALFHFNANFLLKELSLIVGVYEIDENGNPIHTKSLIPYEECIVANNSLEVNMLSPTLDVVKPEDKVSNGVYMGEYDAYVYITKNNPILLWDLFRNIIKGSRTINQI